MNKCDLIKQRTDLLKRSQILTCGMIGGQPIVVETPNLGKLGKLARQSPTMSLSLNSMENRLENKDPKWIEAYK